MANSFSGELSEGGPKNLIYQWPGLLFCSLIYYTYKLVMFCKSGSPLISKHVFIKEEGGLNFKNTGLIVLQSVTF